MDLFPNYSRVQIFRFIKHALDNNGLIRFSNGVYYIPEQMEFGLSTISADDVITKKYIIKDKRYCGVFSGITLLNAFSITTQMAGVIEVVSINESSRKRCVVINGRRFIVRKSRYNINNDNYATYTILQLFSDMHDSDRVNDISKAIILNYCSKNKVTKEKLLSSSTKFPAKALNRLVLSGVLDEIA